MSSSSRFCRPVTLPLLLLLLLSLSSSSLKLADASGQYRPARRLLVLPPSTHGSEQRMRVDGEKKPFKGARASLGRRKIPASRSNYVKYVDDLINIPL
uniref:Uncharacterized protein n=1 Tax=Aegilops tauschii TaxID=37682 RepID=M8BKR7_AEGTA